MVAKYKDRPLEFWDAKNFTFMRELVSNPPSFSCVVSPAPLSLPFPPHPPHSLLLTCPQEWYPTHSRSRSHKTEADALVPVDFDLALGAGEGKAANVFQEKEVLNVMDEVGSLWQISIEGSRVRVVNSTPLEVLH